MPEFNEWVNAPNGTAPESASFIPPGNTLAEKIQFCMLNQHDSDVGLRCMQWLKEKGQL